MSFIKKSDSQENMILILDHLTNKIYYINNLHA
jgi:hypothetical protein